MRKLVGPYFNRHWDIHERGQGNVPESGPVIFASNHIGWLDGPLLFVRLPRAAHALVKEEEFTGRTGRLLNFVGQIKVSRNRNDTGALRRADAALAAGQAVLIYPEGSRGEGEFKRFKGGRDGTLGYYQSLSEIFAARGIRSARALDATVGKMHALARASSRERLQPVSEG